MKNKPFGLMCFFFIIQFFNKTLPKDTKVNSLAIFRFRSTMCIIHKVVRGFRAASPALFSGGNLIVLKPEIPYEIIHSTL